MVGDLSMMHLYPLNGAVHRVGPAERPPGTTRSGHGTMVIVAVDEDPALRRGPGRVGEALLVGPSTSTPTTVAT